MAVTYQQLKIAKGCAKIVFCVLIFGSYWCLKEKNTRFGGELLDESSGVRGAGDLWKQSGDHGFIDRGKTGESIDLVWLKKYYT